MPAGAPTVHPPAGPGEHTQALPRHPRALPELGYPELNMFCCSIVHTRTPAFPGHAPPTQPRNPRPPRPPGGLRQRPPGPGTAPPPRTLGRNSGPRFSPPEQKIVHSRGSPPPDAGSGRGSRWLSSAGHHAAASARRRRSPASRSQGRPSSATRPGGGWSRRGGPETSTLAADACA
jgi:hypothetical protein